VWDQIFDLEIPGDNFWGAKTSKKVHTYGTFFSFPPVTPKPRP
jgi:hypothetical protein